MLLFRDSKEAGGMLAEELAMYAGKNPIVLALPRGGVPVAYEVATLLKAPLDVLIVRKIGAPWDPEFGLGAIAPGVEIFDEKSLRFVGIQEDDLQSVIARERIELERRNKMYRGDRPFPSLKDQTVILVDDGVATGVTTQAAIKAVRAENPLKIILAIPVGPPETLQKLEPLVDDIVCLAKPSDFIALRPLFLVPNFWSIKGVGGRPSLF